MESRIDRFVSYCEKEGIITKENAPWFKYGLEKRLYTFLVMIPFWILGIALVDFWGALAFFFSFFALRRRTNGLHAKTPLGCLVCSLLLELLFLGGFYPHLTPFSILITDILCAALIFIYAPYNHPNCNFTQEELAALKHASKRTLYLLLIILVAAGLLHFENIVCGLTAGIAMAASLLCLAYMTKGGN